MKILMTKISSILWGLDKGLYGIDFLQLSRVYILSIEISSEIFKVEISLKVV